MSEYITRIRTATGEKQIDYNALANLPDGNTITVSDTAPTSGNVWIDTSAEGGGGSVGSTYTKEEILINATKAAMGLNVDAVPDNAFQKLHNDGGFKVGDILTTARTDLDDKWLLCNGDTISKTDYPELKNVMGASTKKYVSSEASSYAEFMAIGGGYIVTAGSTYIQVATSPSGPWKKYNIGKEISSIIYAEGNFVISANDSSTYYPYVSYAADPNGTWTTVQLTATKEPAYGIAYGNGKWVVACRNQSDGYAIVWVASSLSGTWSRSVANSGTASLQSKNCITYDNGTFVICGLNSSNGWVLVSTDLITWTAKNAWYGGACQEVKYLNGVWVATRIYSDSGMIMTATDPLGDWTNVYSNSRFNQEIHITYYDGEYVIVGRSNGYGEYMAIGTSLSGSGWTNSSPNGYWLYGVMPYPDKQCWIAYGTDQISNTNYQKVIVGNALILPEIAPDRAYTYIKAKE